MKCDNTCKYYDEQDGCIFFAMGSGDPKDKPCYRYWEKGKDKAETVHARWIDDGICVICSNCNCVADTDDTFHYILSENCPVCGAKMDLEEESDGD